MLLIPTKTRLRVEGRPIDGILLVDKPAGISSHDVVSAARRAIGTRRIGHGGTLDPFATGLLVLLVGHATRLVSYLPGEPKVYEASIVFGSETDTDDGTGTVVRIAPVPDEALMREAIAGLTGTFDQLPPAYSAKQVGGTRAYAAARRGAPLDLQPVPVTVHEWKVQKVVGERLEATITCGGGTYIRALARDLGRRCDSAAHLAALRRTRSGAFDVADAVSLDGLRAGDTAVRPALDALPHLPAIGLTPDEVAHVRHGRAVDAAGSLDRTANTAALTDGSGGLVAIAERVDVLWQPRVVLPNA